MHLEAITARLRSPGWAWGGWFVCGTIIALLSISLIVASILWAGYDEIRANAQSNARNLAAVLTRDIERNIKLFDLSVQAVVHGRDEPELGALSPHMRQLMLFDRAITATHLGSILALDQHGDVMLDSRSEVPRDDNLASRDYFQIHQQRPDAGLYISAPFRGHLDGSYRLGLSRRLNFADGRFAGVVVGTMEQAYFNELFGSLNIGANGAIALFRDDGALIARQPAVDAKPGETVMVPQTRQRRSEAAGVFETKSPIDGITRIFAFQRVGDLPLVQFVGLAVSDVYAQWWRKTCYIAAAVAALCLFILSLTALLQRQLRRRVVAEAKLSELALMDPLTGLANRRRFGDALAGRWERGCRDEKPLSLLMIDVDFFKRYNDAQGHQAGDEALAKVAACIADGARRQSSIAARYGGEEFAVILPEADAKSAAAAAEAIRSCVVECAIPHPDAPSRILTVSIGVATLLPGSDLSQAVLVSAADRALYVSKAQGRNRCTVDDGSELKQAA